MPACLPEHLFCGRRQELQKPQAQHGGPHFSTGAVETLRHRDKEGFIRQSTHMCSVHEGACVLAGWLPAGGGGNRITFDLPSWGISAVPTVPHFKHTSSLDTFFYQAGCPFIHFSRKLIQYSVIHNNIEPLLH